MAKRKLSKEILDKVGLAIARNEAAEKVFGSKLAYDDGQILVENYYSNVLGVRNLDKYRKKPVIIGVNGSIDTKKIAKDYPGLNPQLFADINKPEYVQIRSIVVSQVIFNSIEDLRSLIDALLEFGFNEDWPDWIKQTQESIFYKIARDAKYNDFSYKNELELLVKNPSIPKVYIDKHIKPSLLKFK